MDIWHAIILGIVEGITEFLPISSTGHLTILEKLFGYSIDDPGITAFTAIIQVGAVLATLLYFRKDIAHILNSWIKGLFNSSARSDPSYKFGWAIILGSVPIGIIGLTFHDQIETTLRNLWFVGFSLLIWSAVIWVADHTAKLNRHESAVTWKDTLIIGLAQCLALIPGVSRSGATISAGLFRGFDRVTATKLSFFLAIPALLAAGLLQTITEFDTISNTVGWAPTITATIVSFTVAYAAVAWLLKFISKNNYNVFVFYRIVLGTVLIALLASNTISAT